MSSESEIELVPEGKKKLHSREDSKFIFFDNNYEPQINCEKWSTGYSEKGLWDFYIRNLRAGLYVTADGKDISTGKGKRLLLTDLRRDVWHWEQKNNFLKFTADGLAWTLKYDPETTDVAIFLEEDKDLPEQLIPIDSM